MYPYYFSNTTATYWSEKIYFTNIIPDLRNGWQKYPFVQWMTSNSNPAISSAGYSFSTTFNDYYKAPIPYSIVYVNGSNYWYKSLKINLLLVKELNHSLS